MTARTVYVVDDDEAVRDALGMLFRTSGWHVETFGSANEFLRLPVPAARSCLVLDIRMPGMSGLDVQDALIERGFGIPIIFITGHGDIPMAVGVLKKGAFDFLEKPFDDDALLARVQSALAQQPDSARSPSAAQDADLEALSHRERQVLDLVLSGRSSRQIALQLFISPKTVEFHRARIMQKLGVRSAAQLFRRCLWSRS